MLCPIFVIQRRYTKLKTETPTVRPSAVRKSHDWMKYIYTAFLILTLLLCAENPVMASTTTTTIWTKANEIMKDIYNQKDRRRIQSVVKANYHHLGNPKWSWFYHGLHHAIFRRWEMDSITNLERSYTHGDT